MPTLGSLALLNPVNTLSYIILLTHQGDKYHYLKYHLADDNTEVQKVRVTGPMSHSQQCKQDANFCLPLTSFLLTTKLYYSHNTGSAGRSDNKLKNTRDLILLKLISFIKSRVAVVTNNNIAKKLPIIEHLLCPG